MCERNGPDFYRKSEARFIIVSAFDVGGGGVGLRQDGLLGESSGK